MRRQDLDRMPMAPFAKIIGAGARREQKVGVARNRKPLGGGGLGRPAPPQGTIELLGMITVGDAVRSANRQPTTWLTTPVDVCPWLAGHSRALDVECEERPRHGRQPRQPRLVHAEPRDSQRDLLSTRRSRMHARPRFHRHRWRDVLLGRKAGRPLRDVAGGAWHSGVSDSQHRR